MWVDPLSDGVEGRVRRLSEAREPGAFIVLFEGGARREAEPRPIWPEDFKAQIDIAPGVEAGVQLEDFGDRLDVIALNPESRLETFGGEGRDPRPLPSGHLLHGRLADVLFHHQEKGPGEKVALDRGFLQDDEERAVREVFQLETRIEVPRVIGPATGLQGFIGKH